MVGSFDIDFLQQTNNNVRSSATVSCSEMHDFFLLGGPIVGEGFIVTFVCLVETGFVVASMKLRVFFFANSIRVA